MRVVGVRRLLFSFTESFNIDIGFLRFFLKLFYFLKREPVILSTFSFSPNILMYEYGAVGASVSIGVSCCVVAVTVELDLFLAPTLTITPGGINCGGTGISGVGAVLPETAAKLSREDCEIFLLADGFCSKASPSDGFSNL